MVDFILIQSFLVALALGGLIGLERESAYYRKGRSDYGGIRTFPLIALFGALSAYAADIFSIYILIAATVLLGGLIIAAYVTVLSYSKKTIGATSEIAGFLAFFIGVLCYQGELILATILTILITIILYLRPVLHHFVKKLKKKEIADTLKFAVVAFVILPFLPNQGYGPLELFNPYVIWLMVVFISGISFVGYILMKWFGEKGIPLLGALGGLASSTATTTSFADQSKRGKGFYRAFAVGVLLANGVMFIRVLIEVFVLNRTLFDEMLIPLLSLALLTGIFSYFLWRKADQAKGKLELSSPFTIKPALKFGIFFAVILALVKIADIYLSSKGVYIVSFISGFADVDAITVSLSQLAQDSLSLDIARNGIILATLTNVAVKAGIAYWFGSKEFGRIVLGFFAALIVVGFLLVFLL